MAFKAGLWVCGSCNTLTRAIKKGVACTHSITSTRLAPCTTKLVVPSGKRNERPMPHNVPIVNMSDGNGGASVSLPDFWAMVAIMLVAVAASMAFNERSRPMVKGSTERGKITISRKGNTGTSNTSGNFKLFATFKPSVGIDHARMSDGKTWRELVSDEGVNGDCFIFVYKLVT